MSSGGTAHYEDCVRDLNVHMYIRAHTNKNQQKWFFSCVKAKAKGPPELQSQVEMLST